MFDQVHREHRKLLGDGLLGKVFPNILTNGSHLDRTEVKGQSCGLYNVFMCRNIGQEVQACSLTTNGGPAAD